MGLAEFIGAAQRKAYVLTLSGRRHYCPVCDRRFRKFLYHNGRDNALCPNCHSFERHRMLWAALEKLWERGDIRRNGRMLDIAPYGRLSERFKALFDYLSIDLDGSRAMRAMDITDLRLPDGSFDAIVCSHVLEHIPDDRKALSELHRVLRKDGWAAILVPVRGDDTLEDLSIVDPQKRRELYGQEDHVRYYGYDFHEKLETAGFKSSRINKEDLFSAVEIERLAIGIEKAFWICLK